MLPIFRITLTGISLHLITAGASSSAIASDLQSTGRYRVRYLAPATAGNASRITAFSKSGPESTEQSGTRSLKTTPAFDQEVSIPALWPEAGEGRAGGPVLTEFSASNFEAIVEHMAKRGVSRKQLEDFISQREAERKSTSEDQVRTLIQSGPAENRIDLVFMGDGYTQSEMDKFHADINRLVDDMFLGYTFKSYLPVFNVHAVFRASNESGIGKGNPRDTAYRLYREGDTLRAIFPGDTDALRESCAAAPDCDYPVVIANDQDYGGLGGEFAISTSSLQSGTVVLRHELGHNFGRVGEEYDGGGYFGANHSEEVENLSWRQWIDEGYRPRAEPVVARFLAWPWHQFSNGDFKARFRSDGKQARASIRISASGFDQAGLLRIALDGKILPFKEPGSRDRTFIDIDLPDGFAAGEHELVFSSAGDDGTRQSHWLSSLTVHEYGEEFPENSLLISAFPVFDSFRAVAGFRPTNEACLMRNMQHTQFCKVCQENNWLKFLGRIELIDEASYQQNKDGVLSANVNTLPLGQFRTLGEGPAGEKIEIRWYADGKELEIYRDMRSWLAKTPVNARKVEVEVALVTPEIRRDQLGRTSQRIEVAPAKHNATGQ
ncbi:MAG: hypothetical protein RIQ81_1298 [Pseudomonadota bacterium]